MMPMVNEEEYFYEFIEKEISNINKQEQKSLQREKFKLISRLIDDLYQNKNSKEFFNQVSNQLILLLTLSNQKKPFDFCIEENKDHIKNNRNIFGKILKNELVSKKE